MTEKVLGFKEKDAIIEDLAENICLSVLNKKYDFEAPLVCIYLEKKDLVPVNLKSKSVTIKWLEKECAKQDKWAIAGTALRELYLAAVKQAKVKK